MNDADLKARSFTAALRLVQFILNDELELVDEFLDVIEDPENVLLALAIIYAEMIKQSGNHTEVVESIDRTLAKLAAR